MPGIVSLNKDQSLPFRGFSRSTFKFFGEIEKNNNSGWFNSNRSIYDNYIVEPARAFVNSTGQFFNHVNPSIRTEPKFNKTLMRISNDMRFSKKQPYKNYFLIHFGRFKMDSEFYVYIDKKGIEYGLFLNNSIDDDLHLNSNLLAYRKEIIKTFKDYKLNNLFSLYTFKKDTELLVEKFNAEKDFNIFEKVKYILLQKSLPKKEKIIYKPEFLNEAIRTFSRLYPLYCYAISPQPLKLLNDFEERIGVAL
jgi:uncharacterized protein (TIGR02453 family)